MLQRLIRKQGKISDEYFKTLFINANITEGFINFITTHSRMYNLLIQLVNLQAEYHQL